MVTKKDGEFGLGVRKHRHMRRQIKGEDYRVRDRAAKPNKGIHRKQLFVDTKSSAQTF